MAEVTFPTAYGGDGKTYTDDADPDTGLDDVGYQVRFVPALKGSVAMAAYAKGRADAAKEFAEECQSLRNATKTDRESAASSASGAAASKTAAAGSAKTADQRAKDADQSARSADFKNYGLGTSDAPLASDLNDVDRNGIASIRSSTSNRPFDFGAMLSLIRGGYTAQLAVSNGGTSIAPEVIALRHSYGSSGEFTDWSYLLHSGNAVGSVSNSATSALFEKGENSSGKFTRFADGTVLLTMRNVRIDLPSSGAVAVSIPLPAYARYYTPIVTPSGEASAWESNSDRYRASLSARAASTSATEVVVSASPGSNFAGKYGAVNLFIYGDWK